MSQAIINFTPPRGSLRASPTWTMSLMEKAKAFPGRKRLQDKVLWFELSQENINYALMSFPMATFIGREEVIKEPEAVALPERPPFDTALPMDELQRQAFEASEGKRAFAFFEKPGGGKTKIILDYAVRAWCAGEIDALLVVSYSGVHEQWILDEAPKHIAASIPWRGVARIAGKKFDHSILKPDLRTLRILAVNYESYAVSKQAQRDIAAFYHSGRVMCALDESHRIMNPDSIVASKVTADQIRYSHRVIASGEPTPRGIENYYSQFRFLDPGIIRADTYDAFKARFCRMNSNREVVGYHNMEELHRLMAPHVHVGAPVIDAEQIFEVSKYSLSPRVRDAYNSMRDELLVEIDTGQISSVSTLLPRMVRLQQIACGFIVTDDGDTVELCNQRVEHVLTLLRIRESQKAIVWARFQLDHARLGAALGQRAAVYNGNTAKARRREIVKAFLDPHSGLDYLVASEGAAGTGLNLQGSAWLNIYHSTSFNAGLRWQSERRTYRRGVTRDVLYLDVQARGTIDLGIRSRQQARRDVSDMSIAELRNLIAGDNS